MSARKLTESRDRPFPWPCGNCATRTVVPTLIDHTAKVKHDGVIHELHLPNVEVPRCRTCGATYPTDAIDDQVSDALRVRLGLLSPKLIQKEIKRIGLKQQEIAQRIGVTPESISRWATGALIQSRAMDNLLKLVFGIVEPRELLRGEGKGKELDPVPERHSPADANRLVAGNGGNAGHVNRAFKPKYSSPDKHDTQVTGSRVFSLYSCAN